MTKLSTIFLLVSLALAATLTAQNRASVSTAHATASAASVQTIMKGVTAYVADTGQAPPNGSGFDILLRPPPGVRNWRGPYIALPPGHKLPTDAWDNPYVFINTTATGTKRFTFQIVSAGPDGQLNTPDDLRING